MPASALPRLLIAAALAFVLTSCSSTDLSPGLTARVDQGATLNRADALNIVNHFRQSAGVSAVAEDGDLDIVAQNLAQQYGKTGMAPSRPQGAVEVRYSAGYFTFADTFSGWRNSKLDAAALINSNATRAGLGVFYSENTPYGAYWVLVLG
jgi:uncharacterized protein YkwD